jgi:hypothetical protein
MFANEITATIQTKQIGVTPVRLARIYGHIEELLLLIGCVS